MYYLYYTPGTKLFSIYLFIILIQVTEKIINFYHIFSLFTKLKIQSHENNQRTLKFIILSNIKHLNFEKFPLGLRSEGNWSSPPQLTISHLNYLPSPLT